MQINQSPIGANSNKPIVTFGILTDIQYADIDDVIKYGRKRYYRGSIDLAKRAVEAWKAHETSNDCKFKFVLQLGDIVDGFLTKDYNKVIENLHKSLGVLEKMFPEHYFKSEYSFNSEMPPKILHCYGNHEAHSMPRKIIQDLPINTSRALKQNNQGNYYWYDITDKLRLICLDQYEISALGFDKNDNIYKESMQLVEENTKLIETCTDQEEINYYTRFRIYNGAISELQLKWLAEQLEECKRLDKKVLLCGHIPLLKEAADLHLCWNSEEILELLWSYDNMVLAYLCGHYHPGGYYKDKNNIHHLTVPAILETPPDSNSYIIAKVFEDKLVLDIEGTFDSLEIYFQR